jgi:hypothetical protein
MKKFAALALFAGLTATASVGFAAEVVGDVKSVVLAGQVIQTNTGIGNHNEANLGSASGQSYVGGDLASVVLTGTVYQSNTGIANSNKANLGSVSD